MTFLLHILQTFYFSQAGRYGDMIPTFQPTPHRRRTHPVTKLIAPSSLAPIGKASAAAPCDVAPLHHKQSCLINIHFNFTVNNNSGMIPNINPLSKSTNSFRCTHRRVERVTRCDSTQVMNPTEGIRVSGSIDSLSFETGNF